MTCARLTSFLDHVLDNLRLDYSEFDNIYQRHIKNKFDSVKGPEFKFLKERLLLVRHLLGKDRDLDPEKRAELIQVLLSDDSLHEAQKMMPNSEKKGLLAKALRILMPLFNGQSGTESEEELLKKQMKRIASAVSDSEFLLGLKSIEIEGLRPAIQEVEALAFASLLSSIADTVKKITHAVLHMQQDSCIKEIQKKAQTNEARAMSGALLIFIRDLNAKSAGRKKS